MKDEIKEILEYIKDVDLYIEDHGYQYKRLSLREIKILLDYITNLQEELKSANESISWWQNRFNSLLEAHKIADELETEYQERNEKAIEYMNNYIELEDAPINERIKTEFKEVIRLLTGGDK